MTSLAGRAIAAAVVFSLAAGTFVVMHPVEAASVSFRAEYWPIPTDERDFPEFRIRPADPVARDREIGIALSGGGTRSASASIGELRALAHTGLLDRVRYVSAVSGGAWTAIPWTFSGYPDLLGDVRAPDSLTLNNLAAPNGRMVATVGTANLRRLIVLEIALGVWKGNVDATQQELRMLLARLLGGSTRDHGTFTNFINRELIEPLVPDAGTADFALDSTHQAAMQRWMPLQVRRPVILHPQPGRPFLIVTANVINASANYGYPDASPLEITPLYVGVRRSVGRYVGGMYTWPVAYNPDAATILSDVSPRSMIVAHGAISRRLTLADVAGMTGSAPLLAIMGASSLRDSQRNAVRSLGGAYFPSFTHVGFREGNAIVTTPGNWAHGDGGFNDNLGIMPLLARRMRNIIAFVNTSNPDFANNKDLRSLFVPGARGADGDKSMNVVFHGGETRYGDVTHALGRARANGGPTIACGTFDVVDNPLFNIKAYSDARVCFVYPDKSTRWMKGLSPEVRALVEGTCADCAKAGSLKNFPWYDTFYQNRSLRNLRDFDVIALSTAQVNLLADLMTWTVQESNNAFLETFDK